MTTTGQKLIFQAALTSVPEQRQAILEKLQAGDVDVGFEALDNLLRQANISQRPLLSDLAIRLVELGVEKRLLKHLSTLLLDEEVQVRNVSWLLCELDAPSKSHTSTECSHRPIPMSFFPTSLGS